MTQKDDRGRPAPEGPLAGEVGSLPPLDHDEAEEPDPEVLADYLDADIAAWRGDDPGSDETGTGADEEHDLIDFEDDGEAAGAPDKNAAFKDALAESIVAPEGDLATADDPVPNATLVLDDAWFVNGGAVLDAGDDAGAEGPVAPERVDVGDCAFDGEGTDLDAAEQPDEDPFSAETLARLGIVLPGDEDDGLPDLAEPAPGLLAEAAFLGPREAAAVAGALIGGAPVAVGEGFFVLGADGMLHAALGSGRLAALRPTSLSAAAGAVLVGTERGGALFTADMGRTFSPRNGWYASGLARGPRPQTGGVSTSFSLAGQRLGAKERVLGLTGEGQLFATLDGGLTWQGPLARERCLTVAPLAASGEVLAVVHQRGGEHALLRSGDLKHWERLSLPEEVAATACRETPLLAAAGTVAVVAVEDPLVPLHVSLDGGGTWTAVDDLVGVTALALDPEDPTWIAAALYVRGRNLGVLRVSDDAGQSWRTALVTGRGSDTDEALPRAPGSARIRSLFVGQGRSRELLAVTGGGVYLAALARPGLAH